MCLRRNGKLKESLSVWFMCWEVLDHRPLLKPELFGTPYKKCYARGFLNIRV